MTIQPINLKNSYEIALFHNGVRILLKKNGIAIKTYGVGAGGGGFFTFSI